MGRINEPLPLPSTTVLVAAPSSAIAYAGLLVRFSTWVCETLGPVPFDAVTKDDLDLYAKRVLVGRAGLHQQTSLLRAVQLFFAWFAYLGADASTSVTTTLIPWAGRQVTTIVGRGLQGENRTARIPPAVMDPLLRSALFYVEHASVDIAAAHAELQTCPLDAAFGWGLDGYSDRLRSHLDAGSEVPLRRGAHLGRVAVAARIPLRTLKNQRPLRDILDAVVQSNGGLPAEHQYPEPQVLAAIDAFIGLRRRQGRGISVYDRVGRGVPELGIMNVALCLAMAGFYSPALNQATSPDLVTRTW